MFKSFSSSFNYLRGRLKHKIEMASIFNINENNDFLSEVKDQIILLEEFYNSVIAHLQSTTLVQK